MKKYIISLSLFIPFMCMANIIYDVDFEPPTFVDGAGIISGPGSDTPSFTTGSPTAVNDASLGSFSSQAAFLNNGGQMEFSAPGGVVNSGLHLFSFEATMIDAVGSNLAEISIRDEPDGGIVGVGFDTGTMRVGSLGNQVTLPYVIGTPSSFSFLVNLNDHIYSAWVNGSPVLQNISFSSTLDITEVRLNTGAPNPNASLGFDNFQWQTVPEPSTFILMFMGSLGCWMRRLRLRRITD